MVWETAASGSTIMRTSHSTAVFTDGTDYTTLYMKGDGTPGFMSELSFACAFDLSWVHLRTGEVAKSCACRLNVALGSDRRWDHLCPCVDARGFTSQLVDGTSDIMRYDAMRLLATVYYETTTSVTEWRHQLMRLDCCSR